MSISNLNFGSQKINIVAVFGVRGRTSGSAVTLKTGRREVPGSNPGRACRPSRSEFTVIFFETRVDPFRQTPPTEGTPPIVPGPTSEQTYNQPTNQLLL